MNKRVVFKRAVAIVVAIAVVFGISAIVATVIHNRDNVDGVVDKPVSSTVKDGLSAYELAVQYGMRERFRNGLTPFRVNRHIR